MQRERVYPVALIVHTDGDARAAIVHGVRAAGFQGIGVAGFDAAKYHLGLEPVDVLITEARLGDFHGVHLVLLARYANPAAFAAVLTTDDDAVLQRDVEAAGGMLFIGNQTDSIVAAIQRTTLPPVSGELLP